MREIWRKRCIHRSLPFLFWACRNWIIFSGCELEMMLSPGQCCCVEKRFLQDVAQSELELVTLCTFTFSGKKILHSQENLAFARKPCFSKKILLLQENLAFARKSCKKKKRFLSLLKLQCTQARKCYIWKKNLAFTRKIAFARKSCQSNEFVHLPQNLAKARISFH